MSFDAQRLFELLPAIYRLRDEEGPEGSRGVLRALVDVLAEQVAVLEEDLDQLYDDQFIETCAEWVAPYIGDVVGYRTLYGLTDKVGSPRAEVANTIAYRRRKGTASMLEQLGRDVTGWDARVVEFFRRMATTQYINHVRASNVAWVDLRQHTTLAAIDTPFDTAAHTLDVRRIARRRGRYNIPNVGLYLWRIRDYRVTEVPAVKLVPDAADDRRYLFHQTGANAPLFSHAVAEDTIAHVAGRANVPMPIGRRELWDDKDAFYPASVSVRVDGHTVPPNVVSACDLSDTASGWAYDSGDTVLIDPALGRLRLPASLTVDGRVVDTADPVVTFHYGCVADMGGGPYSRVSSLATDIAPLVPVTSPATIASALGDLDESGIVEVRGHARFAEPLAIVAPAGARIELRAADGVRPTIVLDSPLTIELGDDADVTINGFLITGAGIHVLPGSGSGRVRLRHCTLVPGIALAVDGTPTLGAMPSLVVGSDQVAVEIDHCILGGIRARENASVRITGSIVDAADPTHVAYAAVDGLGAGGEVEIVGSTVIGKVHARILRLVSNSILLARLREVDSWPHAVRAERRQDGCVRFSYLPFDSETPRRHRCVPARAADAVRVQPQLSSERYGDPAYAQLSGRCPVEIRTGADDESEMGAYHDLFGPQRETNVQVRLDEYLRFGLEAGVFFAS
jgi:hypothetical protein